jgi:DNA-directed RNA polymerase subunit RPC12/RpoP
MMELKVLLSYACSSCEQTVHATVKCAGKGLASGRRTVARVNVPCPDCGSVSQVFFEPSGTVRSVTPYRERFHYVEPSIN